MLHSSASTNANNSPPNEKPQRNPIFIQQVGRTHLASRPHLHIVRPQPSRLALLRIALGSQLRHLRNTQHARRRAKAPGPHPLANLPSSAGNSSQDATHPGSSLACNVAGGAMGAKKNIRLPSHLRERLRFSSPSGPQTLSDNLFGPEVFELCGTKGQKSPPGSILRVLLILG